MKSWDSDSLKQNFLSYVPYKGLGKYSGGTLKCWNRKLTEQWQSKLASSAERNCDSHTDFELLTFLHQFYALSIYILSLCMWLGCQKITLLCFLFLKGNCWKPFSSVKMHFDSYFSNPLSSLGPLHFFLGSGKFPLFSLSWILFFRWHLAGWRTLGSWEKKLLGGLRFRIYTLYFPDTHYWFGALALS